MGGNFFRGRCVAKLDGDGLLIEGRWLAIGFEYRYLFQKKGDQSVPLPRQKTH
jgi:hypothetical protein